MAISNIDQQIIELRKNGLTQIETANKLGIGRSRVERICKEFDVHISPYAELTEEIINKVLELREQKIRQEHIAEQVGISRSSVQKIFKQQGVKSIPIEHWKITPEIEQQIMTLREEGLTQRQIAKKLNIGKSSVDKAYKRLGIKGLPNGKITPAIWEQILQLKEEGMIIPDIAKEIGVNRASIQAQFNKRSISIAKFHITPEIEKVILQLRAEGNGSRNIANILGCARSTPL